MDASLNTSFWCRLCVSLLVTALTGIATAQTISISSRTGASVKELLGVNAGPGPQGEVGNVDATAAYQQRGVTLVRTHDFYGPLDMATMYPDRSKDPLVQSSYNFTASLDSYRRSSDSVFAAIVNGGFEPYFRIGDSYNNVTPPTSSQLSNWVLASVQVLKHYRQGQWNGNTSGFRFAEIGNEPDNPQFWPSPLTSDDFNKLYDQTAKALRAAFPTLKIGGPGWAPTGCLASSGQAAVRSLLDYVRANGSPMDFMSFHVYGKDSATYLGCAQFYRTELDSRGLNSVELHISEWNTSNAAAGSAEAQLRYNAQGAAYMTAAWINLQNGGVEQSTFYRGTDPGANSPEFYGMFYGDGRAKKVADAFSLWRDFTAYLHVLQSSGAPTGITTMASENDAGARAVLIANPSTTSATTTFSFSDGKTLADYSVGVSTVTDETDGAPLSVPSGVQINIPAKSVVLVRLTPKNYSSDAPLSLSFSSGWNLAGDSVQASINVATSFNDATKVGSVWKWTPATSKWAFYTPTLSSADLSAYAASQNYTVLSAINGGEGFWVKALAAFSLSLPTGTAVTSASLASTLRSGWNLISTGDNKTPRSFNNSLAASQPILPTVAASAISTLWAWDATLQRWRFYASSLDNSGGLAAFASSNGYLDFGSSTLVPGQGFWVNKP